MSVSPDVGRSWALSKSMRSPWEGRWTRLQELAMPSSTRFGQSGQTHGQPLDAPVYDETGMVGIAEMASRLQTGILPDGVEWARLEGDAGLPDTTRAGIAEVQTELFAILSRSNLSSEVNDSFRDLSGPGNCCMSVVAGKWDQPLLFQAISLADVWITPGPNGTWADIHVRHRVPGYALRAQWPNAELPESMRKTERTDLLHEVIESWVRDLASPTERWLCQVHIGGTHLLTQKIETGAGACPYIFGRWNKSAGDLYATGQGMLAMPSMQTCNEIVRLILLHGSMALTGMFQAEDDGVLNPWSVQLVPGAIVPIAPGSKGLQPIQLPGTRLDIGQLVLEEQRSNIKKALYNEQLGPRVGTPMTAFETQERMQELARSIGPAYGRVWREFAVPLLLRAIRLLKRAGRIALPEVDGRAIRLVPASSFVRSAGFGEVQKMKQWAEMLAALYGPQALATLVPPERFARISGTRMDVPSNLMFSPEEQRQVLGRTEELLSQIGQDGQNPGGSGGEAMTGLAPILAGMGMSGDLAQ